MKLLQPMNLQQGMVSEPQAFYMPRYIDAHFVLGLSKQPYPSDRLNLLKSAIEFNNGQMASVLHISERTLQRLDPDNVLPKDQAERYLLLTLLFIKGEALFGHVAIFKDWLMRPNQALGGATPFSYLDTVTGFGLVNDELTRLEHGVYA